MNERKADAATVAWSYLVRHFYEFRPEEREFQELVSSLQFVRDNYGYEEISIADSQGKIKVSTREDFVGLSVAEFDYFRESLKGQFYVTRVHPSVFPIRNELGKLEQGVPTLFISGPIRDESYSIIGVTSLRMDVRILSKEMRRVKLGETGETYLVDENGYMLTESRFVPTLREMGLIKKRTALELRAVDPNTGKLTKGVQACLKGKHGYDTEGYPDYRGVKVIGFWHWIPEYRWGLMSEIDADEAFRDICEVEKTRVFLTLTLILAIAVAVVFLERRLTAHLYPTI